MLQNEVGRNCGQLSLKFGETEHAPAPFIVAGRIGAVEEVDLIEAQKVIEPIFKRQLWRNFETSGFVSDEARIDALESKIKNLKP